MNSTDTQRAKDLSARLAAAVGTRKISSQPAKIFHGLDGRNGRDGSSDTPEQIALKLNSLEGSIEAKVIKDLPTTESIVKELRDPKGKHKLEAKDILNMPGRGALDMRWHGAGLTAVSHDPTLSGDGTPSSPLSVVGGGIHIETPTGTVDGVNTVFTVVNAPTYIVVDGLSKFVTLHYTYAAGTITIVDGAPPVQFIRSFY